MERIILVDQSGDRVFAPTEKNIEREFDHLKDEESVMTEFEKQQLRVESKVVKETFIEVFNVRFSKYIKENPKHALNIMRSLYRDLLEIAYEEGITYNTIIDLVVSEYDLYEESKESISWFDLPWNEFATEDF